MKFASTFLLVTLLFLGPSCSMFGERSPTAEYSLHTSTPGANVYRSDGKVIGQTPLVLGWKDIEDVIDGRFVSFLVEKPGYYTRVVFFDATDSVNIKIDLDIDKQYREKRKEVSEVENEHLKDKNKFLLEQKELFVQSISDYKSQLQSYQTNMNALQKKLKYSEFKVREAKKDGTKLKSVVPLNLKPTPVIMKSHKEKVVMSCPKVEVISQRVESSKICPKVKTLSKFYPKSKTNQIIRELLAAQFLIMNNEFPKARNMILELEKVHPHVGVVYTLLAYIEVKSGNSKKAKRYLRKSLQLDRRDKMAKRMMNMLSYEGHN
jgi:hypothetical protein